MLKVPESMTDMSVLLLSDILPTAWHSTEMAEVQKGDRVAIWGAGPGGLCLCKVSSQPSLMAAVRRCNMWTCFRLHTEALECDVMPCAASSAVLVMLHVTSALHESKPRLAAHVMACQQMSVLER